MKEKIKITIKDLKYYLDSETLDEITHKAMHRCNGIWLTNCHWMVRRTAVDVSAAAMKMFNDSDVLKARQVDGVLMNNAKHYSRKPNEYTVVENTGKVLERECFPHRRSLFKSEDNKYACFDEEYIKLFEINKLVGIRTGQPFFAFKGKTIWFAIMPCLIENKKYGWKDMK